MGQVKSVFLNVVLAGFLFSQLSYAAVATIPPCPSEDVKVQSGSKALAINNEDVLAWKHAAINQEHHRAHVKGKVIRAYEERNGHLHYSIQIGRQDHETIEVVYNQDFATTQAPAAGVMVEACGDYITATAPSPGPNGRTYPPSPDGAIIHWLHMSPSRSKHSAGYMVINGVLFGQKHGSNNDSSGIDLNP
jgi:hypothetical protein